MNHIAKPSTTSTANYHTVDQIVPCLGDEPYDGGDFLTYPARRGFDQSKLMTGDFTEHDATRTAVFLQDWLYFGTLVETLGVNASKSLFVVNKTVTTANFEELLHRRISWICQEVDKNGEYWSLIRRTEACLTTVSYYCCLVTDTDSTSTSSTADTTWPLSDAIDTSIRLLGQRIANAYTSGLGNIAGQGVFLMAESILWQLRWPSGPLLISKLRQLRWCASDIDRALDQFSPSTIYYVGQLDSDDTTSSVHDHSRCTNHKCLAFQVNEDTYKTRHVNQDCDCGFLGPDIGTVVDIINAGKIPLLTLDINGDDVRIIVEPHMPDKGLRLEENYDIGPIRLLKSSRDYVAISHVWADGLGNARYNALPYCQLRRLKATLDELRDQKSSLALLNMGRIDSIVRKKKNLSLRFWMDTLCVPVDPSLKQIRSKAIRTMTDIYHKSQYVLVIDRELQGITSAGLDHVELFMRISLSGWMRRLWTLQEGVLGGKLQFKFGDRILDIQQMYTDITQNDRFRKFTAEQNIARQLAGPKGSPQGDAVQFLWRMRTMRAAMFSEDEGKSFGYKSSSSDAAIEHFVSETRRLAGIMAAFEAARYRTTSRAEDVYLCLGGLLGWSIANLSTVPPDKRLRLMLEDQKSLPQGIIFVPGPRNADLGWKWAVTDFDNEKQTMMKARIDDLDPAVRDTNGLMVRYPGLVLPAEAKSILPVRQDIVVASLNGEHRTWWHFTLLEEMALPAATSTLVVLYYAHSPEHIPHRLIPMAAVVIAIDASDIDDLDKIDARVAGPFQALANVQLIGNTPNADIFMGRRDCHAVKVNELAGSVNRRSWIIQ